MATKKATPPPLPVATGIGATVNNALTGVWTAIWSVFTTLTSYLPFRWKKYVALVGLFLLTAVALDYALPTLTLPSWPVAEEPVAKIATPLPKVPSQVDFDKLDARVEALESRTVTFQVTPVPLISGPKPKPAKAAAKKVLGDDRASLYGVLDSQRRFVP